MMHVEEYLMTDSLLFRRQFRQIQSIGLALLRQLKCFANILGGLMFEVIKVLD